MQGITTDSNPAVLSEAVAGLFAAPVLAAELDETPSQALLTQAELAAVSHCSPLRIAQFTAGRLCARRALEALGVTQFSLLPAADRQPIWPEGVAGSITHTEGFSAAVVGRREAVRSLGIDTEISSEVRERLWPRITAPAELEQLRELPQRAAQLRAAVLFAAKEAFYKCQFALTAERLAFADVAIRTNTASGEFQVLPQRPLRIEAELDGAILVGRCRRHGRYVTAGLAIPAKNCKVLSG
jgi:4'-phosphopantetheinyl transferase EntD